MGNREIQPTQNMKEEDKTMKAQKLSIPHHEETLKKDPNLQFNKLQQSEGDLLIQESRLFGDFVAREAILDEEYWTAAWLRAESHWEDRPNERLRRKIRMSNGPLLRVWLEH